MAGTPTRDAISVAPANNGALLRRFGSRKTYPGAPNPFVIEHNRKVKEREETEQARVEETKR